MNFASKGEIFQSLRTGIAGEVARCSRISGAKRTKTDPVNKKLWKDLYPKLLETLRASAVAQAWPSERLLDSLLRLFYCSLVVNLEARNRVVPYDYMDFARRVGEVWEDFCKVCWDAPVNQQLRRLRPPDFASVRQQLLTRFSELVEAGHPTNKLAVMREYQRAIDLLGNINLTEDEYCSVGQQKFVIDFKSGFGSNEKGNTERLLTVAKIYGLLPDTHQCVLAVRAAEGEGNNYLQVLKSSGLWKVCCGSDAYDFIKALTGFDLAAWIRRDVAFREDMETEAYCHLTSAHLTKYLAW
jgi:hypothetical protein